MTTMNSYEAMSNRASLESDKNIKSILTATAKALKAENAGILESCYQLSRLQAITPEKWANAHYKGFGDAVNQCFGMSESVASRRALVGRVFCQIDDAGKPTYGKYAGYSFSALVNMAESFTCDVASDTLKAVDKFTADKGITSKTAVREIVAFLKESGKKESKGKSDKATANGKTSSDNKATANGQKTVEVVTESAIADFGKNAQALAKTVNAEQLAILMKLVRAYETATGTTIAGCTTANLKKLAGVDKATK